MARQKVEGLLTQLHERFADSDTSPQQEALLQQLQGQLEEWEGPLPADGNIVNTAELLLEEVQDKHPQLSRLVSELLDVLGRLGI
jgi:ABC-type transporter Mla subunit MlaD